MQKVEKTKGFFINFIVNTSGCSVPRMNQGIISKVMCSLFLKRWIIINLWSSKMIFYVKLSREKGYFFNLFIHVDLEFYLEWTDHPSLECSPLEIWQKNLTLTTFSFLVKGHKSQKITYHIKHWGIICQTDYTSWNLHHWWTYRRMKGDDWNHKCVRFVLQNTTRICYSSEWIYEVIDFPN